MRMRTILATLGLALLLITGGIEPADAGECRKLTKPVSGEGRKYSVQAQVDGTMAFADIPCALHWRNTELCATELTAFQFSAMVVDYLSGKEILMSDAFYVVASQGEKHPVAFDDRLAAEEFIAKGAGGELLDHQQLLDYPFK